MTGMIIAGADLIKAVKYQIFIIFTTFVVQCMTGIFVSYFTMKEKNKKNKTK